MVAYIRGADPDEVEAFRFPGGQIKLNVRCRGKLCRKVVSLLALHEHRVLGFLINEIPSCRIEHYELTWPLAPKHLRARGGTQLSTNRCTDHDAPQQCGNSFHFVISQRSLRGATRSCESESTTQAAEIRCLVLLLPCLGRCMSSGIQAPGNLHESRRYWADCQAGQRPCRRVPLSQERPRCGDPRNTRHAALLCSP